jgi:hypothetical protein
MRLVLPVLLAALALSGCDRAAQNNGSRSATVSAKVSRAATVAGVTPMAERVAVLGFLNKRNGIVRDLTLKPGQALRIKDAIVRLRACEASAPWENEALTGAFIQLDVQQTDGRYLRAFSGWLYKESPSLNVVEHPVYDVWPKSCAMTYPAGAAAPATPVTSSNRSSAKRSGSAAEPAATEPANDAAPAPAPAPTPEPVAEPVVPVANAAESNAT